MKVATKSVSPHIVSTRLQLAWICATTLILLAFFYKITNDVIIRDPYAPIHSLTPQQIAQYGGTPAEVTVGLFVRDVPKFDPVRSEFLIDAVVWFSFDPRLVSLERLKNFSFERTEVLYKSEPNVSIKDTDLFVRFDVRLRLNATFNYRDFPFDDHRLNVTLIHEGFTPAEVTFDATRSNLELNPLMSILGWHCFDWRVMAGFTEQRFAARVRRGGETLFPTVVFSLDFKRVGSRHIVSIFIPLLLIFFIALFTFSIDPLGHNSPSIITLSATAVTALIAYRFVIESMSPAVGYFLASDYIFLAFLMVTCSIFFCNIFGSFLAHKYKTMIVVFMHLIVIATFFFSV